MIALKTLYETDFNLWLEETANLLREGKLNQLDIKNLLEEIEGMSRSEKDALESNLIRVLQQILKWHYQPERRSASWSYTIYEHSRRINKAFKNSPSLKRYFIEIFEEAYQEARKAASLETGLSLSVFPTDCPYSHSDVLDINLETYRIEN